MGSKIYDKVRADVNTSADSTTNITTINTTSNKVYTIKVQAIAQRTFNTDTFVREVVATFKNVAGTVSQVGSTATIYSMADTSISGSSINFSISGTDITISVTGVTGVLTINWQVVVEVGIN